MRKNWFNRNWSNEKLLPFEEALKDLKNGNKITRLKYVDSYYYYILKNIEEDIYNTKLLFRVTGSSLEVTEFNTEEIIENDWIVLEN